MFFLQMQVFNQYIMLVIIEMLDQMVEKFNVVSCNIICLIIEGFDGDFFQELFFVVIYSVQCCVDCYVFQVFVFVIDLIQLKYSLVKIVGGFGLICFEFGQLIWLQKLIVEGIEVVS